MSGSTTSRATSEAIIRQDDVIGMNGFPNGVEVEQRIWRTEVVQDPYVALILAARLRWPRSHRASVKWAIQLIGVGIEGAKWSSKAQTHNDLTVPERDAWLTVLRSSVWVQR